MSIPGLALTFPVCDGDQKHFERFAAELVRLDLPWTVHFDHCCKETKRFFLKVPGNVGHHSDDEAESFFDESFRNSTLEIVSNLGFSWLWQMDVDETLELRAPEKLKYLTELKVLHPETGTKQHPDLVDVRVLDLWGDGETYRVDGPFAASHREKLFHLRAGKWRYPHPTTHAPKLEGISKRKHLLIRHFPLHVYHWGIMNMEDVKFHTERWTTIYQRKVGGMPYGFYNYLNDPQTVPLLRKFNPVTWERDWVPGGECVEVIG